VTLESRYTARKSLGDAHIQTHSVNWKVQRFNDDFNIQRSLLYKQHLMRAVERMMNTTLHEVIKTDTNTRVSF
jgi:hypothetical protein